MNPKNGELVLIKSVKHTMSRGGRFNKDLSEIIGQKTEVLDHIPAGTYPGINPNFSLFEVCVDGITYFLHEGDCEVIPVQQQLDFADVSTSFVSGREACCTSPRVLKNSALGEVFFVCTNCKKEVNEGGKLC